MKPLLRNARLENNGHVLGKRIMGNSNGSMESHLGWHTLGVFANTLLDVTTN